MIVRQEKYFDEKHLVGFDITGQKYQDLKEKILQNAPKKENHLLEISYIFRVKEFWKEWGKNYDKAIKKLVNENDVNLLRGLDLVKGTTYSSGGTYHTWDLKFIKKNWGDPSGFKKRIQNVKNRNKNLYNKYEKVVDDFLSNEKDLAKENSRPVYF